MSVRGGVVEEVYTCLGASESAEGVVGGPREVVWVLGRPLD